MNITVKEILTKILNPLSSDTTVDITCFDKIDRCTFESAITKYADLLVDRIYIDGFDDLLYISNVAIYIK